MKAEFQKITNIFEEEEAGELFLSHFHQGEESPQSSYSLNLLQQLNLQQFQNRHELLVSVAVNVAQEQEPAVTSGQLPTKLPWLRQPLAYR